MKNVKTGFLAAFLTTFGLALFSATATIAGEIRQSVTDAAFVPQGVPNSQNHEVFRFELPNIPQGSRIDFAALIMHVQRDSTRGNYLFLKLDPITSDWTPTSLAGGQVVSVDETSASYAVADYGLGDRVELDITSLVTAWTAGTMTNRGFLLKTEIPEDATNFSVKSTGGVKADLVVYYTAPEKK